MTGRALRFTNTTVAAAHEAAALVDIESLSRAESNAAESLSTY
jgi:hypothetical protein